MNFQILNRSEIPANTWDLFCLEWGGTLNHLTHFLDYYVVTNNLVERSFGVLLEGKLIAVVPIVLPGNNQTRAYYSEEETAIINQCPLIASIGKHNELVDFLSTEMFIRIPLGTMYEFSSWKPTQTSPSDYLEHLFIAQGANENLLVDLTGGGEEHLFKNLSRGHRRTIKKSISDGQSTFVLDSSSSTAEINEGFSLYREAHAIAAGRVTRSNESFELMLEYIHKGIGSLFIGKKNGRNLSFLYCDSVGKFSRGWSQANSHDLIFGEFPRHQTEWEAMKYFGNRGIHFYHLGTIHKGIVDSSAKLDSIKEYKLRFHPISVKSAVTTFTKDNQRG